MKWFIIMTLLLIPIGSAVEFGYNNLNLPQVNGICAGGGDIINNYYNESNSSEYWDDLDTPSDISGSEYWTNHSLWIEQTYGKWFYNMTTPFTTWLSSFVYNYNQTTPAIDYADTKVASQDCGAGQVLQSVDSSGTGICVATGGGGINSIWSSSSSASISADAICWANGYSVCSTTLTTDAWMILPKASRISNLTAFISTAPANPHNCTFSLRNSNYCNATLTQTYNCTIYSTQKYCNNPSSIDIDAQSCLLMFFDEQTTCAGFLKFSFDVEEI